ncbi:MAG: LacI family DNA-binding transcriptional regulator, partial [Lentisphaeria bacterium]|nr:LacI family DNA-binding transcriptional regulator [Lentisphaeria bacterium]
INFSSQSESLYQQKYIDAVKKTAGKAGIEYCEYPISSSAVSEDLHSYFEIEENTGYIVINMGTISNFYGASVLLDTSVKSIYVDGVISGSDSILADSFDGMRQLVEELIRQGCQRFIYAENYALYTVGIGVAEKYRGALFHTKAHGFQLELVSSGSYEDLLAAVRKKECKTAVMFPQDTPAGIFLRMLKKEKIRHVTVSGFDHFSLLRKPPEILTVEPDFELWAQKTLSLLRNLSYSLYQVCFLPVKLCVPGAEGSARK